MDVVVAITGASGVEYGITLLKTLYKDPEINVDLIISDDGKVLLEQEGSVSYSQLVKDAVNTYRNSDMAAPVSSGSRRFDAMVIVPCTMSTLAKIANGISDNLITRVASVAIKEHRKLVIVPRETPLSAIQLRNMAVLSDQDVIILPASPGFYHQPEDISGVYRFIASRILDQLGIDNDLITRWGTD